MDQHLGVQVRLVALCRHRVETTALALAAHERRAAVERLLLLGRGGPRQRVVLVLGHFVFLRGNLLDYACEVRTGLFVALRMRLCKLVELGRLARIGHSAEWLQGHVSSLLSSEGIHKQFRNHALAQARARADTREFRVVELGHR